MHVPIGGISWKVTFHDRIYIWSVLCLSEEILLLKQPSTTFPFATYLCDFKLNTLTIVYSSSDQPMSSAKAQGPIYNFGPLSLHIYLRTRQIQNYIMTQEQNCASLWFFSKVSAWAVLFSFFFLFFIWEKGTRGEIFLYFLFLILSRKMTYIFA